MFKTTLPCDTAMLDITGENSEADIITVSMAKKKNGWVLWINTPERCVFRACRVAKINIEQEP